MTRLVAAWLVGCVFLGSAVGADRVAAGKPKPIELTPRGTVPGAKQPQATIADRETIHVVFAAGESIHLTTSSDGGVTFGSPRRVGTLPGLMAGMRRGPRIAARGNSVVISAIGSAEGNLVAWHSADGGQSWQGPVSVNNEPKSCREGLHGMAIGPHGEIACVWLDLRQKKTELYGAVSSDGGATWSENQLVYRSPDGFICECCHPSVAYGADGTLFAMWRNQIGGNRDLYLTSSTDGGRTFANAQKLGTGTWKKDACPMDGGALAITSSGKATTVWRRDQQLFFTAAGETREQKLGPGEQPTVAAGGAETWMAWVTKRPGSLLLAAPRSRQPVEVASGALDPVLASGPDGGPVVLVWETGKGKDSSVWFASLAAERK